MRLPVHELALFAAVVGCLASGTFALGWYFVAKRTSPRVHSRHLVLNLSDDVAAAVAENVLVLTKKMIINAFMLMVWSGCWALAL